MQLHGVGRNADANVNFLKVVIMSLSNQTLFDLFLASEDSNYFFSEVKKGLNMCCGNDKKFLSDKELGEKVKKLYYKMKV